MKKIETEIHQKIEKLEYIMIETDLFPTKAKAEANPIQ